MAVGGFKLNKYEWTGTGTGDEETRLDSVLSNIVENLCNNTGWEMDTNYHDTSTSFEPSDVTMYTYPFKSEIHYNKICFLTNGTLYLALGICSGIAKLHPDDIIYPVTVGGSGGNLGADDAITGLYFSISKSGNWNTTDSTYGTLLPSDATKWSSFGFSHRVAASAYCSNFIRNNIANVIYSYYFLTNGNHLAIFAKCSSWGTNTIKCIIAGEIIGSLAHQSEDDNKLGCISLCNYYMLNTSGGDIQGEADPPTTVDTTHGLYNINQENYYFQMIYNSNSNTQFFRGSDASLPATIRNKISVPYDSVTNTGAGISVSNEIQLNINICNPITGGTRWCPLQVYIQSNDPVQYGVVENDGFKGYLDTDFIRAVTINQYALGSTFGVHKEFCYIGAGLAIGWDESITESLF